MSCQSPAGSSICTREDTAPIHIIDNVAISSFGACFIEKIQTVGKKSGDAKMNTWPGKERDMEFFTKGEFANNLMLIPIAREMTDQRKER